MWTIIIILSLVVSYLVISEYFPKINTLRTYGLLAVSALLLVVASTTIGTCGGKNTLPAKTYQELLSGAVVELVLEKTTKLPIPDHLVPNILKRQNVTISASRKIQDEILLGGTETVRTSVRLREVYLIPVHPDLPGTITIQFLGVEEVKEMLKRGKLRKAPE